MGLKVRLGLAVSGLLLSSMFGVNMLSGIKDYVDTTGNIMVDIADGIGMVAKGIEYLEYYLDPDSQNSPDKLNKEVTDPPATSTGSDTGTGAGTGTGPDSVLSSTIVEKVSPGSLPGDQPAVFCQKGKCYPYDPNKLKNPNMNLEAKPGMILTASPQPSLASPAASPQPSLASPASPASSRTKQTKNGRGGEREPGTKGSARPASNVGGGSAASSSLPASSPASPSSSTSSSPPSSPSSSIPPVLPPESVPGLEGRNSTLAQPTKMILTNTRALLDNTSKLLVRLVSRMFPWNRRARRRLEGEEDEL